MINKHVSFPFAVIIIATYAIGIGILVHSVSVSVQAQYDDIVVVTQSNKQK